MAGVTIGRRDIAYLAGLVLICLAAGGGAGLATAPEIPAWYRHLVHPAFTPPDWLFGPVWTLLYLMMAVAAWRAWRVDGFRPASAAIGLFLVQLAFNFFWSFLFFGFHRIGAALADIAVLWAAILLCIRSFRSRDAWSAVLMLPYFGWVSFAACLNAVFWRLN